ncbi:MAG: shikimate dehydrogenase [Pelovirga sp.]
MQILTGNSKVYGIFGDPVAHSLSPLMHTTAFAHCGIDAVYVPFQVTTEALPAAVSSLRALDIKGINVTIPHKEAIIPLLDHVDPTAKQIGAVNTVVNDHGRLIGYNTDSSGFMRSVIDDLGFSPQGKKVLLLGAGGACRAAVQALLATQVQQITVANRHLERAVDLITGFKSETGQPHLVAVSYRSCEFLQAVSAADLLINTTSVGLHGESLDFLPLENIKGSALIFDMVYSTTGTALVRSAQRRGFTCIDGLSLLAAQGEDAFFIWTGKRLPHGFMRQTLVDYLA